MPRSGAVRDRPSSKRLIVRDAMSESPPAGASAESKPDGGAAPPPPSAAGVLVTGGSGFVGRHIIGELLKEGYRPVCLARSPDKLRRALGTGADRVSSVHGDLLDGDSLRLAARGCRAAIHLVGIIQEEPSAGQTFERVHVDATRAVIDACERAGVPRLVHMSAIGARPDAPSRYHQTKWAGELLVRSSALQWTIFRPSLIHGPDNDFMRMMKFMLTHPLRQPVLPYFGNGQALLQPVSVKDVATCFVRALSIPEAIGQTYELGGPERVTWTELYDICSEAIVGRRRLKMPIPVTAAKLLARAMPLLPAAMVPYKFDVGQVQMSQEDNICDPAPAEQTFGIRMRDFRRDLFEYAGQIGEA